MLDCWNAFTCLLAASFMNVKAFSLPHSIVLEEDACSKPPLLKSQSEPVPQPGIIVSCQLLMQFIDTFVNLFHKQMKTDWYKALA